MEKFTRLDGVPKFSELLLSRSLHSWSLDVEKLEGRFIFIRPKGDLESLNDEAFVQSAASSPAIYDARTGLLACSSLPHRVVSRDLGAFLQFQSLQPFPEISPPEEEIFRYTLFAPFIPSRLYSISHFRDEDTGEDRYLLLPFQGQPRAYTDSSGMESYLVNDLGLTSAQAHTLVVSARSWHQEISNVSILFSVGQALEIFGVRSNLTGNLWVNDPFGEEDPASIMSLSDFMGSDEGSELIPTLQWRVLDESLLSGLQLQTAPAGPDAPTYLVLFTLETLERVNEGGDDQFFIIYERQWMVYASSLGTD